MATGSWNVYAAGEELKSQDFQLRGAEGLSASTRRLKGGLSDGVDLLIVANGPLRINLLPTRGMGIWSMSYSDVAIGWRSPVAGPVHPAYVNLAEPSGLGWLDGFDELLVRCGLESNGAPDFDERGVLRYGLHGRIANRPAQQVHVAIDSDKGELTVEGVVDETRFHFSKLRLCSKLTTRRGEKGFALSERIENLSQQPTACQLLYHINIGAPLLDEGSKVVAPVHTLVPRDAVAAEAVDRWDAMPPPKVGVSEQVYFMNLHKTDARQTQALLCNASRSQGVSCAYDAEQLPCFTLWKNPLPAADGYVVGLEPGTNFPNPRSYEAGQGRLVELGPGESMDVNLRLDYLSTAEEVDAASRAVDAIKGQSPQHIFSSPQPGWTSSA